MLFGDTLEVLRVFLEKQIDRTRCQVYGYASLGLRGKPKASPLICDVSQVPQENFRFEFGQFGENSLQQIE